MSVSVDSDNFLKLNMETDFLQMQAPTIDARHWLEKLEDIRDDDCVTWISALTLQAKTVDPTIPHLFGGEHGGQCLEINIYARLEMIFERMFEQMHCSPQSFECHWRLCENPDSVIADAGATVPAVNSTDVDGSGAAADPLEFKLPLLPHQRRSLHWMLQREQDPD